MIPYLPSAFWHCREAVLYRLTATLASLHPLFIALFPLRATDLCNMHMSRRHPAGFDTLREQSVPEGRRAHYGRIYGVIYFRIGTLYIFKVQYKSLSAELMYPYTLCGWDRTDGCCIWTGTLESACLSQESRVNKPEACKDLCHTRINQACWCMLVCFWARAFCLTESVSGMKTI